MITHDSVESVSLERYLYNTCKYGVMLGYGAGYTKGTYFSRIALLQDSTPKTFLIDLECERLPRTVSVYHVLRNRYNCNHKQ